MFDSVLQQRHVARQRAVGGAVSFLVHGAIIAGVVWYGLRPKVAAMGPKAVPVAFLSPRAAAPAAVPAATPAPPPPAAPKPHPRHKAPVVKKPLVIPKEVPKEKPPETAPDPQPQPDDDSADDDAPDSTDPAGVPNGVANGVAGGKEGGAFGGGGGGDAPVFFGEGMTKPEIDLDASESFHWTTAQRDAHVEGLCLVQCTITKEGLLKNCKILKRLPMVDDAQIMDFLAHVKFHPSMHGGQPISIKSYTIPFRLKQ